MALTTAQPEDYSGQLSQLMPTGPAWSDKDSLLAAFADGLSRIHNRSLDLIENSDVRTANELFSDWERVTGLPGPCVSADQSTGQRRAALVGKIVELGGQSPAYFIGLAAALGYTITITEYHEFTVDDDVDAALWGPDWVFAWMVTAPLYLITELTVDDTVADALAAWGDAVLECVLNQYKPTHTILLFAYI